jgi:hypothetical protein
LKAVLEIQTGKAPILPPNLQNFSLTPGQPVASKANIGFGGSLEKALFVNGIGRFFFDERHASRAAV